MDDGVALTRTVVDLVEVVVGSNLVGAYLHGSAVQGGLRPSSDVDVLVVVQRRLSQGERVALVEGLLEVSGRRARRGPARPVELTVVVASDVRPWRYPPVADFQYGEWLRDDYETGLVPQREESPDLAPLVTMVLQGDRALVGPPPAEVFDAVPAPDLRDAIVHGIPGLLEDLEDDTRNVLLTFARIWTTLATSEVVGKDAAAAWVLARLPEEHRGVLERARDAYLGGAEESWDDLDAVRAHVAFVAGAIEREAGAV